MSKIRFSKNEIDKLSKNKYVLKVNDKAITYTNEFKIHFIAEYSKGKTSKVIFEEAGFDVYVLGIRRIDCAGARWRKAYKENGILGLDDTRRNNSGRPRQRKITKDEIIAKQNTEIEYLKAEVELLKKLELHERQVKKGKLVAAQAFMLIESIVKKLSLNNVIKQLCNVAAVSRSGYYNYLKSKNNRKKREKQDEVIKNNVLKAFNYRGYKKGSRSIKMTLKEKFGINYSRKRIQRIMRKFNIVCPIRKPNPYKRIAKATKEHTVVPNILNRNFKQDIPGKVLLTDITYLPYSNSNIKLAKDAFIHSDQGSHYTSPTFQKLLKSKKLGQSMSRRGNCWDNAPQESFFGHMKDEINYKSCSSLEELQLIIDDYIDYYNNERCQWNLKKLTPVKYRNQLLTS